MLEISEEEVSRIRSTITTTIDEVNIFQGKPDHVHFEPKYILRPFRHPATLSFRDANLLFRLALEGGEFDYATMLFRTVQARVVESNLQIRIRNAKLQELGIELSRLKKIQNGN